MNDLLPQVKLSTPPPLPLPPLPLLPPQAVWLSQVVELLRALLPLELAPILLPPLLVPVPLRPRENRLCSVQSHQEQP